MHFPFTNEPYKTQMGLKPLNLKDWIEIDDQYDKHLAMKREILRDYEDTVLGVLDEAQSREAAIELYETLVTHLKTHFPDRTFKVIEPTSAREALAALAGLAQEDFCLLSPEDQVLMAGIVCFPSRWKLPDKIGKNSDAIHRPVNHFNSIAKPTAMSLKQFPLPLVRFNWTIHDSPDWFCPEALHHDSKIAVSEILEKTFLRVERQTLRRLPRSGAIVFSIRTFITALSEVVKDPDRHQRLKITLDSLPQEVAEYKGMRYFFDDLKEALKK